MQSKKTDDKKDKNEMQPRRNPVKNRMEAVVSLLHVSVTALSTSPIRIAREIAGRKSTGIAQFTLGASQIIESDETDRPLDNRTDSTTPSARRD